MSGLDEALEAVARVPVLLVASDYDGTVAPIVEDPDEAQPDRESVVALRALSALPQTHVAVISGRALRDLARLCGLPEEVHLVGSHGSEFDQDFARILSRDEVALHRRLRKELDSIASRHEGIKLEQKPASIAVHYRRAAEEVGREAVERVLAGPGSIEGVYTRHGKKVVELAVVATNKGAALETIRHRAGASAVIFFGDDATDEDAFATLKGPDVGIKVGDGESQAAFRVGGPGEVARRLAQIAELREAWLEGSEAVPIEQHALLSDQRTIALLSPAARITWLCAPRIDSHALFAELLGGAAAGRFAIRPVDPPSDPPTQRYLGDTLVVETAWPTCRVVDYLDTADGRTTQRAGRSDVVRLVTGTGMARIEFAPRLDFGRIPTNLVPREDGLAIEGSRDPIVLRAPGVEWRIEEEGPHHTAYADVALDLERPIVLELRLGSGSLRAHATTASDRRELTASYWSAWAAELDLPEVAPDAVRRSALTLKALCYGPTGAIAAAGTTSLPEHLGGVRNWDYRYCWLRDAAMAATALLDLGSRDEGMEFLDWMLGVLDHAVEAPERLHPLYTVLGRELGPEAELAELSGYAGSRPVRVGNAASGQMQLDVFGPIIELVHQLSVHGAPLSHDHWRLVEDLVRAVERRWREPDHGIWEIRKPVRHHVHSKVMCWVTVDRAIAIGDRHLDRAHPEWEALRTDIADDVLRHGWKDAPGAFTAAYDGDDLDAAALVVGLSGLLPADDPRFAATVEAVERHLRDGPTVYRYRADDWLPGFEGGFHLCASWLVDSLLLVGRRDDAESLFEDMLALPGQTGLLSEQYDPRTRRALGNHPQAYSHIGIIQNAVRLSGRPSGGRTGGW